MRSPLAGLCYGHLIGWQSVLPNGTSSPLCRIAIEIVELDLVLRGLLELGRILYVVNNMIIVRKDCGSVG